MTGTMSLWGMLQIDPTILDDLIVPAGVNLALLQNNIALECAELEILYSDAGFLKEAIRIWSNKELPTWTRIAAAASATYNPIENYNRIENVSESTTGNKSVSSSASGSGTTQNSNSTLEKVSGYNSDSLVNRGSSDYSGAGTTSSSSEGSGSEEHADNMIRQSQIRGNIGVTTSQQMLTAEVELSPLLNIYNYITTSFKRRFCLLIYT